MAPASAADGLPLRLLQGLRRRFRSGETGFIALALLVGIGAGLTTWLQAALAHGLQGWLFGLSDDARLSASLKIGFPALLALPVGGLLVGLVSLAATLRKRRLIDAVEANAARRPHVDARQPDRVGADLALQRFRRLGRARSGLHADGSRLRLATGQRLAPAPCRHPHAGRRRCRRRRLPRPSARRWPGRSMPSKSSSAPIRRQRWHRSRWRHGSFIAQAMGMPPYLLPAASSADLHPRDFALFALLGLACALIGVAVMRLVAGIEQGVGRTRCRAGAGRWRVACC
jgi:CIC family chloride channel protein